MTLSNESLSKDQVKILLIGLDNSGKTSILTCLEGIKQISAFNSIQPTRGADTRSFEALDSTYVIWDLGGQKAFRDEYFEDFSNYLNKTRKIIYVIDLQDTDRHDEAVEYMKRVIDSIDKQREIDFSIFLHKFDPDLVFNQKLNEKVIKDLIRKIKIVIPPNFIYSLYKTSIFAIFEKEMI